MSYYLFIIIFSFSVAHAPPKPAPNILYSESNMTCIEEDKDIFVCKVEGDRCEYYYESKGNFPFDAKYIMRFCPII